MKTFADTEQLLRAVATRATRWLSGGESLGMEVDDATGDDEILRGRTLRTAFVVARRATARVSSRFGSATQPRELLAAKT